MANQSMCSCRLSTAVLSVGVSTMMAAMFAFGPKDPPAEPVSPDAPSETVDPAYVLDYEMNRIDGTAESLEAYKGKVVLIVNTASKCGLTPQYEGLEALYREKEDDGFVILGFPANQFMGQEPGSNAEIAEFCTAKFDVTFPMFEKIAVKGEDVHPLYEQLAAIELEQPGKKKPVDGPPTWNFAKFLVDREGHVVARFGPRTKPSDEKLNEKIDELLEG